MLVTVKGGYVQGTYGDVEQDRVCMDPTVSDHDVWLMPETGARLTVGLAFPGGGSKVRAANAAYTPQAPLLFDEREWITAANSEIVCTWMFTFKSPPIIQCTANTDDLSPGFGYVANPVKGTVTTTGARIKVFKVGLVANLLTLTIPGAGVAVNVRAKGV